MAYMSKLSGQPKKTVSFGFKQRKIRRMICHNGPRKLTDIKGEREVFQKLVKKPLKLAIL